ncbi:ATP-binding cassette domain-containing protein [Lagierella sp.]|uniref:ABC transporter ATP-binding protein n=1 Tax=Lagierella sp. TaxID=2849657 RepID=UPI00261D0173|nr:ATP-binding cassette domain-containing protein [Lagierella sp.]
MLEVENITKTFTTGELVTPIENVSLKVKEGRITTISGESGTGKSTFLMVLGGLLQPTEGRLLVDGKDFWTLDDKEKSKIRATEFGYLFQSSVMIKALTIGENIQFASEIAGRKIDRKEILALLNDLGIEDKINSLPHTLSGGQRRRAMLAINYGRNPKIIIADEPTNDLDEHWKKRTLKVFEDWKQEGKSIILASHDPEVESLGDIKYIIKNKTLIEK